MPRRRVFALSFLLWSSLWSSLSVAQTPVKMGAQVRVNSAVQASQTRPAMAALQGGGSVIVWQSTDIDAGIRAQRFAEAGKRLGTEIDVDLAREGANPEVAALPGGGFVVIWHELVGQTEGIYGQRFSATGARLGSRFLAITTTAADIGTSRVAALSDGTFIVLWRLGPNPGRIGTFIYGQRHANTGGPIGNIIPISSTALPAEPSITVVSATHFVVTWTQNSTAGTREVVAQRFANSGEPANRPTAVNLDHTADQSSPRISKLSNGQYAIVWGLSAFRGLKGQRFDLVGRKLGGAFDVTNGGKIKQPTSIAPLNAGGFVVLWNSREDFNGQDIDVVGRRFTALAAPSGDEFRVNTTISNQQQYGVAVQLANGQLTAAWESGLFSTPTQYDNFRQNFSLP